MHSRTQTDRESIPQQRQLQQQQDEEILRSELAHFSNYAKPIQAASLAKLANANAKRLTAQQEIAASSIDTDVIVCASEERTQLVARHAMALGQPYLAFKVIFVEGVMGYGGEASGSPPTIFDMTPWYDIHATKIHIFCSLYLVNSSLLTLGDQNNVHAMHSVISLDDQNENPFPLTNVNDEYLTEEGKQYLASLEVESKVFDVFLLPFRHTFCTLYTSKLVPLSGQVQE